MFFGVYIVKLKIKKEKNWKAATTCCVECVRKRAQVIVFFISIIFSLHFSVEVFYNLLLCMEIEWESERKMARA